MKIGTLNKKWMAKEIAILSHCYKKGVPLSLMSKVLGRSETAINKALTRQNIRPLGLFARGVKKNAYRGNKYTYKQILTEIKEYFGYDLFTTTIQDLPDDESEEVKELGSNKCQQPAFYDFSKSDSEKARNTALNKIDIFTCLGHVLLEAKRMSINVTTYSKIKENQVTNVHYMNGQPTAPYKILAEVNKKRLHQGKGRLLVERITEY